MTVETKEKPKDMEVRIALLEDFKERTLEHHRQTMEKLDTVLKILGERQCTLHSARMLQIDQDLKHLKDIELKDVKDDLKILQYKIAFWSGSFAFIAFIASKLW